MKRTAFLAILAALPLFAMAQSLTWDDCKQMAHTNYPVIKQYGMVASMRDYNVSNAAKGWLPQISVEAGANAFTDILDVNERMKQMGVDTKNYAVGGLLSLKQSIYDGGQIRAAQDVAKAQADVETNQLSVTMHDVDERIEQLFFGVLTLDEQLRQNALLQQDLLISAQTISSLMAHGLANQGDMDVINVEKVRAEQQADALSSSRKAYVQMLATFIGKDLNEDVTLVKPQMLAPSSKDAWGLNRPEMAYYASRNQLFDAQRRQLDTRLRPTVGLIGAGLIHTNVSSMVHNATLLAGVSLTWNVGALYTRKTDLRRLDIQRQQNDNLRETFLFNNRLQNEEADGKIQSLRKQLSKDTEIVALQERIRQTKEKKVKLGTETVNELVRSINSVSMARQQQSLHELQLLQSICHSHTLNSEQER